MAYDDEDLFDEEFDFVDDDDSDTEDSEVDEIDSEIEEEESPKKQSPPKAPQRNNRRGPKKPTPPVAKEEPEEEEEIIAAAEEPLSEPVPVGPPADHVVHIYEFGDFKRTIQREFTADDSIKFAEEFNRTSKAYGRHAVPAERDEEAEPHL